MTSRPRPLDYDYHDFRQPANIQQPPAPRPSHGKGAIKPPGMETFSEHRAPASSNWATPLAGPQSIWSDRYEWLRLQVRKLHRHGLQDQLGALQEKYPAVNLTLLYEHYSKGGLDYDTEDSQYMYYNGTYQPQPYYGDTEEGYWHNGTYFPGEAEVPEREDGYFYNGTWYPGVQDWEEGGYYNGTYYPGEEDAEDAYYYNGTRYSEGEEIEDGQERMGHKGMMLWQQPYHPGWKDAGANNVQNNKQQPVSVHYPQNQQPIRKWEGHSGHPAPQLHQQHRQQPPQNVPGVPQKLPMIQQRPPPRRLPGFDRNKVPFRPPQANANPAAQHGQRGPPLSGTGTSVGNNNNPGKAALTGNGPTKEQIHPSAPQSIPPAVSWGIVFAAILGISIVLAPLACLLYKYRQQKRVKKRTFLKRPEHGSVDDGILDALVMKELGEQKDSRVREVDKAWGRNWKKGKSSKDSSTYRTTYELKPLPTSTTAAHVHDQPRDSIT